MANPAPPSGTMRAVVFHGPKHVAVEDRPVPEIREPTDALVRVHYTALCGSELHVFRGHQASGTGFIMGHEFTGVVHSVGDAVKSIKAGDRIVAPFTTSCGACFYCQRGASSRCAKGQLFGSAGLDGAQAEWVRVPLADSTLVRAPENIPERALVLMADIFPTGFFAARNGLSNLSAEAVNDSVVVVVGCGPVGLCAVANARAANPKHLIAVDAIANRLEQARALGAEPWNFQSDWEGLKARVKELTDGRGADVAIEVVGLSPALRTAFDLLRPWGTLSSVGVHNAEIPWTGNEAYGKNLRLQMGRCPVRSVFHDALSALEKMQDQFTFMADNIMSLEKAVEGYEMFEKMVVQKVVFEIPQDT